MKAVVVMTQVPVEAVVPEAVVVPMEAMAVEAMVTAVEAVVPVTVPASSAAPVGFAELGPPEEHR